MTDMKFSARLGDDENDLTADGTPFGAIAVGVLLVGIGGAMLAERLGVLPQPWRLQIWPVLLIAYGIARLVQPRRRGRRGLVFVLAGAWWLAVLSDWLSPEQTWPLLVVAYGADVVLGAMTTQPGQPTEAFGGRRHRGGMGWVFIAILAGAFISSGGGRDWSRRVDSDGQFRSVVIAARSEHHVESLSAREGAVVTVMGTNVIDLRDLPASSPSTISLGGVTAMGKTVIRVPADWVVDMKSVAIMGRAFDRRRAAASEPIPADDRIDSAASGAAPAPAPATPHRLVIHGAVVMGTLTVTQ